MSSPASSTMTLSDMASECSSSSSFSAQDTPPRIRVSLPFSQENIVNKVEFNSGGSLGVCLASWLRLSDKRQSHRCLDDPDEILDELLLDSMILYQSQWPGYDAHTCYVPVPSHVAEGHEALKKIDLLDMVCEVLARWILTITRCRHIECTEPEWAIGLDRITFKHIYVVAVAEISGYASKWVPILEVDSTAFDL
ncbi:hypothetical protein FKP32DRAFT_1679601 [Trametes sanguinea]|nr:hypothetical protein FKP32DRAFT_1679601 [Trametes sanguinea]